MHHLSHIGIMPIFSATTPVRLEVGDMVPFFNSVGTTLNVNRKKCKYDCVLKNNRVVCDGRERQRERHRINILHTRTLYERMR